MAAILLHPIAGAHPVEDLDPKGFFLRQKDFPGFQLGKGDDPLLLVDPCIFQLLAASTCSTHA